MELNEYLLRIENKDHKAKFVKVLDWVKETFPQLEMEIKWNQPMFIHKGTFIIAFSTSKKHMGIAPEFYTMEVFRDEFAKKKVLFSKMMFKYLYNEPFDLELLGKVIQFNINDKDGFTSFWR